METGATCDPNPNQNTSQIDVAITELVLTPLTCAVLINELLKCLLYEKSQIPYPYSWLKSVINRKRRDEDGNEKEKPMNLTVQNYYRLVSTAYDSIEDIMGNIRKQFEHDFEVIKEVVIVLGTTPFTPKEVFTIRVPKLASGHIESNHSHLTLKNQHKVLRNICLSSNWMKSMQSMMPSTNTYVMLKKKQSKSLDHNDSFVQCKEYYVPPRTKNLVINLMDANTFHPCCTYLEVFEDNNRNGKTANHAICHEEDDEMSEYQWYQATSILKGFKDCYINKTCASELW